MCQTIHILIYLQYEPHALKVINLETWKHSTHSKISVYDVVRRKEPPKIVSSRFQIQFESPLARRNRRVRFLTLFSVVSQFNMLLCTKRHLQKGFICRWRIPRNWSWIFVHERDRYNSCHQRLHRLSPFISQDRVLPLINDEFIIVINLFYLFSLMSKSETLHLS